ncbi:MAG TPA: type II methionyl aminopeptidase [Candidatus Acidoferrum sp.]|nr:type II methionyl aminopeptidase [Candidatus Acidoferrum sp.]
MISKDELEAYRRGGQIISQLRRTVPTFVHEGGLVRELCERVEAEIIALGGQPAFPCNVGINEVAAHYTSPWDDASVLPKDSVVKVDFGVHIDGYINDSAVTVSLSPIYSSMIEVAEEALRAGITRIAHGVRFSEIGEQIEKTIAQYGCRPIRNLTGHKVERYTIHAGQSIPNVSGPVPGRFEVGEVYAIEPFVTLKEAAGRVEDSDQMFIFRAVRERGVRSQSAKKIVEHVRRTYRTLPFASRWLYPSLGKSVVDEGFSEAVKAKCISGYPVLVEASGRIVTQAEHTVVVKENGCEVLAI